MALRALLLVAMVAAAAACGTDDPAPREGVRIDDAAQNGRLQARPQAGERQAQARGLHAVDPDRPAGALVYVPAGYRPGDSHPFVLTLHGAGGSARGALEPLRPHADEFGLILLAPQSGGPTWDVIREGYGPDVAEIDRLLSIVFRRYAIDPERAAISGFSDGASYALSLGLTNGDLFRAVTAFSPGFTVVRERHGKPRVFISHGTQDDVLPIDRTSRQIVPRLERSGLDVTYLEFKGGHTVPPEVARAAVEWWLE